MGILVHAYLTTVDIFNLIRKGSSDTALAKVLRQL